VGRRPKSAEVRGRFWQARASGATLKEAAAAAGVSRTAAHYWLKESGGVRPRPTRPRPPLRLSLTEREEISRGLAKRMTLTAIATKLRRSTSTVSREVKRNSTPAGYRAVRADRVAQARTRRPRPPKLATHPELRAVVEQQLSKRWSPQQISRRLKHDFPHDASMRVSHETIYTSLFVQAKGGLPGHLSVHLRTGRVRRRPQRRVLLGPPRIKDMVPIQDRPEEATHRLILGHWEGDLVVGRRGGSHVGTLVERRSRYLVLLHLPSGAGTDSVITALAAAVHQLPPVLRRSVTWDRGIEMTRHRVFTEQTKVPVFFCDARSPWQRGSNENTNGLLRQYLPKGTDLSRHSASELNAIAAELNNRPRRILGWRSPSEVLIASGAMIA
jgi:transposase, IS30 family